MIDQVQLNIATKRKFLEDFNWPRGSEVQFQISVGLGGVNLALCFHYEICQETKELLATIYRPFPVDEKRAVTRLHFHLCDAHPSLGDPFWNTQEPFLNLSGRYTIQRDFVAHKDQDDFHVLGPRISRLNPDTLDNAVLFCLAHELPKNNSILLHACGVVNEAGKAYLFFAPSGHGKSTLSVCLNEWSGLDVIASDNLLVTLDGDKVFAQSTPIADADFPIGHGSKFTRPVEVEGIFYLECFHEFFLCLEESSALLTKFLREQLLMYFEFTDQNKVLELSIEILERVEHKGRFAFSISPQTWIEFKQVLQQNREMIDDTGREKI
jgi:hypothetical protein